MRHCLLFFLIVHLSLLDLACRGEERVNSSVPRVSVVCGPNAVLMFLVLCGADANDESLATISCGDDGASLLQLRDFCNSNGVRAEVRKFGSQDILRLPLPAILLSTGNHYVVAYRTDTRGIDVLDGTTGAKMRIADDRFDSFLSGYALVRKENARDQAVALFRQPSRDLLLCVVNIVVTSILIFGRHKSR